MIRVKIKEQPKVKVNILDQLVMVGDYENYTGEYEVIPKAFQSQELKTKGLVLNDNIVVKEIPYAEVSNLGGGVTITIA